MILAQLRREMSVRSLLWWIPTAVVTGSWILATIQRHATELEAIPFHQHASGMYIAVFIVWMWLSIYLMNTGISARCPTRLDTVLPLSTRRLWLVHLFAIIASGLVILAVMAGVVVLGNAMSGRAPLLEPGLLSFGIHFAVGLVFTVAVLQSPKPTLYNIPVRIGYIVLLLIAVPGYLGLVIGLSALPRIYALIPLGAALVLGIRVYRSLPSMLALAPLEVPEGDRPPEQLHTSRSRSFLWLEFSTVWRNSYGHWTWLYLPLVAFHGFILGLSVADAGGSVNFVPYLIFTFIILSAWFLATTKALYRIEALPIARSFIFVSLVLPALLTLALGYGAGMAMWSFIDDSRPAVSYLQDCCPDEIQVPRAYWEISRAGEEGLPLFSWSDVKVYNPFRVDGDAEKMLSLATEAVYGKAPPAEQYGLSDQRGWGRTFPVVMLFVSLAWLLFIAFTCRTCRSCAPSRGGLAMVFGCYIIVLLTGMGLLLGDSAGFLDLKAVACFLAIVIHRLGENIPGGAPALWAAAALLISAGYWLALSQFRQMEIAVQPGKKSN